MSLVPAGATKAAAPYFMKSRRLIFVTQVFRPASGNATEYYCWGKGILSVLWFPRFPKAGELENPALGRAFGDGSVVIGIRGHQQNVR